MNAKTYNHSNLTNSAQRVDAWCEWVGIPKPDLDYEDGQVLITDEFLSWMQSEHVDLEWIAAGNPEALVVAHVFKKKVFGRIIDKLEKLSKPEQEALFQKVMSSDESPDVAGAEAQKSPESCSDQESVIAA